MLENIMESENQSVVCGLHLTNFLSSFQELEEFWAYQELLGTFVKRLTYCVSAELLPLMEIPGVKLGRAKQLYNAGFQSVASVAAADPEILVKSIQQIPRKAAKQIVASAKVLLNEKAEVLLQEVEELMTVPVDRSAVQSSQGQASPWDDMDLFSSLIHSPLPHYEN
ncbi:helicase POLQ-like [Saccostrea cucullata]|uniref:helicase POLQ-like n=1 Tax=Saccostrea cuccullata TaxID=36930 RepID=UPI002ED0A70C